MKKIAKVGYIGNPHDNIIEWKIEQHFPEIFKEMLDESNKIDIIDLKDGRDFLKETEEYDIAILYYVYRNLGRPDVLTGLPNYFAVSELNSWSNWLKRLISTKASTIILFGNKAEISSSFIGPIPNYKLEELKEEKLAIYTHQKIEKSNELLVKYYEESLI